MQFSLRQNFKSAGSIINIYCIGYNMGTNALPDVYQCMPSALGVLAHISIIPILQLLHKA